MKKDLQEIKALREQGKSLRDIASIMGKSPGSISGLMSRNRDIFPITSTQMSKLKEVARQTQTSNQIRKMFFEALNPPTAPPKPKEQWSQYDQSRMPGISLVDLDTRKCCRWPILDTFKGQEQMFCGEVKAGKNYCQIHQERAWRAA